MKTKLLFVSMFAFICLAASMFVACQSSPAPAPLGAAPQHVSASSIYDTADAATGSMLTKGDGGVVAFQPATSSTSLAMAGAIRGTTAASVIADAGLHTIQGVVGASPYTPALVANWSDAGPTSIANALDRLAAKAHPVP